MQIFPHLRSVDDVVSSQETSDFFLHIWLKLTVAIPLAVLHVHQQVEYIKGQIWEMRG